MTLFLRLLADVDKEKCLVDICHAIRNKADETRIFEVNPRSFPTVPGAPFAYWISDAVRNMFRIFPPFESKDCTARQGLATAEDFRFVRAWWEEPGLGWYGFAKGGIVSNFYSDIHLMTKWKDDGVEVKAGICKRYPYLNGNAEFVAKNPQFYFRPGLTWPRRTKSRLSMRVMPRGCIFADKGPAVIVNGDDQRHLLSLLAICTSDAFYGLVEIQLAAADEQLGGAAHSFEVGIIQRTPVPELSSHQKTMLADLAYRAWSLKRSLDTVEEISHPYILPVDLRTRVGDYDPSLMVEELALIQSQIDSLVFKLYGFEGDDQKAVAEPGASSSAGSIETDSTLDDDADDDDDNTHTPINQFFGLASWAVGVAFGRFDWDLATGKRAVPPEPSPLDPLPTRSPGMLPESAAPFHPHPGILVDDPGHKHDLARVAEEVLTRVDAPMPSDTRRWLQRDFFPFHLQRYSKSRRKAPVYWPLATASGGYTLWLYYPNLDSQTLYTAINEFVEPKLEQVGKELAVLRNKGNARGRDDDKVLEALQTLEKELVALRDTLLQIAPSYQPNREDGVQITAAPLWSLFRHKPWQKLLKDTWAKLENGDYDWSHLAMAYWPGRVREKCKTDKSLAIAHGLEALYEPPPESTTEPGSRGRKRRGAAP